MKNISRDEFYSLKKKNSNIYLKMVIMSKNKLYIPMKSDDYVVDNVYDTKEGNTKTDDEYMMYYMTFNDFDKALEMYKKYDIFYGKQ